VFNAEGKVDLLSSEMHQITGVPHLVNRLQKTGLRNLELDGEVYCHQMTQGMIHSIVSRKVDLHPNYEAMEFHIFDLVNPKPQEERLRELQCLETLLPRGVYIIPTFNITGLNELENHLTQIYDKGYEGVVLRHYGNLYRRTRSNDLMKLKPKGVDVYLIVDTKQEVDIHGKAKEALGAFVCAGEDLTLFGVGTGPLLTRDHRVLLWQQREYLKGMYLQIKYEYITEANRPYGSVAQSLMTLAEYETWKKEENANGK
jgi:ATP-dependent DNA ligase